MWRGVARRTQGPSHPIWHVPIGPILASCKRPKIRAMGSGRNRAKSPTHSAPRLAKSGPTPVEFALSWSSGPHRPTLAEIASTKHGPTLVEFAVLLAEIALHPVAPEPNPKRTNRAGRNRSRPKLAECGQNHANFDCRPLGGMSINAIACPIGAASRELKQALLSKRPSRHQWYRDALL